MNWQLEMGLRGMAVVRGGIVMGNGSGELEDAVEEPVPLSSFPWREYKNSEWHRFF